jgi:hypothetical protein
MIFRECGIGSGCRKLEIEFGEKDTFEEKQIAYKGFEFMKAILQLNYHSQTKD